MWTFPTLSSTFFPHTVQFVQRGPQWLATLFEVIPSFALFRGLYEMSQYAFLADVNSGPGRAGSEGEG